MGHPKLRRLNPLHRTRANAESLGNLVEAIFPALQGGPDGFLSLWLDARPADRLATLGLPRCLDACQSGFDALLYHRSLELGEDAHHLEERLASGCRGVDRLLMDEQINLGSMYLPQEIN